MNSNNTFEKNKARIAQAVENLSEPPLDLLRVSFAQRQLEERGKLSILEREAEGIRKSAYQAALRLSVHQHDIQATDVPYVEIIKQIGENHDAK